MSVDASGGGADRNEHGGSVVQAVGQTRGERQPPLPHVRCHELLEARLVDRDLAGIERVNLAGLLVDAGDLMTKIGNASPRNEADIARPDHRNPHEFAPKRWSGSGVLGLTITRSYHGKPKATLGGRVNRAAATNVEVRLYLFVKWLKKLTLM